jgi:RimJ/RimL family protein N-acetyltransferase
VPYVTVTYLDERPIAAFWGEASGKMVHLGMLIYSPFLARHSPGKLHIMQLSEHLIKEGKDMLDLTPGGDPWKERFANAHDEVAEAIVYMSPRERTLADTRDRLLQLGKRYSARAGITPANVTSTLAMLRRARPSAVVRKIRNWSGIKREFRIYRGDRTLAERCRCDERVRCNSLSDLLSFEPGESWQTRDAFLSSALARLQQGEFAYTVSINNHLAHFGWMIANQAESYMTEVKQSMTFPPGSVSLYDFYSHPEFRGRGLYRTTIGHILYEAFADEGTQYAYISVLADNLPSRHVIETMGFEYQRSFFWERRFGTERKWASPMVAKPEAEFA